MTAMAGIVYYGLFAAQPLSRALTAFGLECWGPVLPAFGLFAMLAFVDAEATLSALLSGRSPKPSPTPERGPRAWAYPHPRRLTTGTVREAAGAPRSR